MTSQRDDALDAALEMLRAEDITRSERTHPLPEDQTLWKLYAATFRGRRRLAAQQTQEHEQPLSNNNGPAATDELEYEAED